MNWADFRAGAMFGGGANGYLQSLALELRSRGVQMISLTAGWTYRADGDRVPGHCRVERLEDFEGVARFEIVNSPIVAPGIFQATNPDCEIASKELDGVFQGFIATCEPDVVHFHNIEGFSASCVHVLKALPQHSRPAVVFSLHNYHTLCPQVYLMRGGRSPCIDFEGGAACETCVEWTSRTMELNLRCGVVVQEESRSTKPTQPSALHPLRCEFESLSNDPEIEGPAIDAREPHGRRRQAMIEMLSACDTVLAVSDFVRRKFISMGVDPNRIRHMPIGTTLADSHQADAPVKGSAGDRPIRLAFIGYHNYFKGLHMLADSLEMLDSIHKRRIEFFVYAKDLKEMEIRLRGIESDLAGLFIRGEYDRQDLPRILGEIDVGVVPSVWWDNAPQTVMEFLACGVPVVGAELGGIPELIRHGVNGWTFRGNDRVELSDLLTSLITNPQQIDHASRNIRHVLSMKEHATEMMSLYASESRSSESITR